MTVSEVREVMRRAWAANAPLLALMYAHDAHPGRSAEPAIQELQSGRGPSAEAFRHAYNMFFLQVIVGTPLHACMHACMLQTPCQMLHARLCMRACMA